MKPIRWFCIALVLALSASVFVLTRSAKVLPCQYTVGPALAVTADYDSYVLIQFNLSVLGDSSGWDAPRVFSPSHILAVIHISESGINVDCNHEMAAASPTVHPNSSEAMVVDGNLYIYKWPSMDTDSSIIMRDGKAWRELTRDQAGSRFSTVLLTARQGREIVRSLSNAKEQHGWKKELETRELGTGSVLDTVSTIQSLSVEDDGHVFVINIITLDGTVLSTDTGIPSTIGRFIRRSDLSRNDTVEFSEAG